MFLHNVLYLELWDDGKKKENIFLGRGKGEKGNRMPYGVTNLLNEAFWHPPSTMLLSTVFLSILDSKNLN